MRIERGAAGGLPSLPDPAKLVEAFRDGGLAALVQTKEQRALMGRMQAAMAVVEGYSEHVMDAIAAEAIPGHEALRAAMDARRRSRSAPERLIERLLGLDMKMRQYEQGKVFCDAVAARPGWTALNRVWESPESLPTPAELEHPRTGWRAWARPRPRPPRPATAPELSCNPRRAEVYVHVFGGIVLPNLDLIRSRPSPDTRPTRLDETQRGRSKHNGYSDRDPAQGDRPEGCCDPSSQRRQAQPVRPARPRRPAPRPS